MSVNVTLRWQRKVLGAGVWASSDYCNAPDRGAQVGFCGNLWRKHEVVLVSHIGDCRIVNTTAI